MQSVPSWEETAQMLGSFSPSGTYKVNTLDTSAAAPLYVCCYFFVRAEFFDNGERCDSVYGKKNLDKIFPTPLPLADVVFLLSEKIF